MFQRARSETSAAIRPGRGRLFYVVLLALAWIQVSYASHQFEHVAGDITDACSVCSQFDRFEHCVTACATSHLPHAPSPDVFPTVSQQLLDVPTWPPYCSRAPPVV